jgi:hypothetical protein
MMFKDAVAKPKLKNDGTPKWGKLVQERKA